MKSEPASLVADASVIECDAVISPEQAMELPAPEQPNNKSSRFKGSSPDGNETAPIDNVQNPTSSWEHAVAIAGVIMALVASAALWSHYQSQSEFNLNKHAIGNDFEASRCGIALKVILFVFFVCAVFHGAWRPIAKKRKQSKSRTY